HIDHARGTQELGASQAGAPKHFLVKRCAVELISGQTNLITPAELARLGEVLHLLIGEPEAHSLLHEMRLVEILRKPQHAPHEIRAHLDRRLPDAAREPFRFLYNQKTQP